MTKKYKSVGFKSLSEKDDKSNENVDPYPISIELPDGYWTITTTGKCGKEKKSK